MNTRIAFASILLSCSAAAMAASPTASLGLLVDSANAQAAHDGLRVLGATPGSVADQLGLRPGDVLVDVNGTSLANLGADADGHALATATLNSSLAELPPAAPVRLRVLRDGVVLAMNAPLHAATEIPATAQAGAAADPPVSGGCGRISVFDVAPRSQHLYRARSCCWTAPRPARPVRRRSASAPERTSCWSPRTFRPTRWAWANSPRCAAAATPARN